MTVGQLKKLIADLPEDMQIVTPGYDHSYVRAHASTCDAECHAGDFYEYYNDANMVDGSFKVKVLVVG